MSSYFELKYFPKKVHRAYSMGALDAAVQGASFYVEKIKLASKLSPLETNLTEKLKTVEIDRKGS